MRGLTVQVKLWLPLALLGIHEATLTADGKFMYTTLRKANRVVVVRTADDKIVATIPQKGYPDLVTMEPSGRYALVTNRYAAHVACYVRGSTRDGLEQYAWHAFRITWKHKDVR